MPGVDAGAGARGAIASHRHQLHRLHRMPLAATILSALGLGLGTQPSHLPSPFPAGSATSAVTGEFGPVAPWPIIPIHAAVLADGRIMSFGTDEQGRQGALMRYDVWNPARGTQTDAHLLLPNTTGTDIFCSAQTLLSEDDLLLIAGGDAASAGVRNFSTNAVTALMHRLDYNLLYPLQGNSVMKVRRWYPSILTLASGETLVMGGRVAPGVPAPTPEIMKSVNEGWRSLTGATNDEAYGLRNMSYPRAWQAPNGKVFILPVGHDGKADTFYLDATGSGSITATGLAVPMGQTYLPSVMYRPGQILALRNDDQIWHIDLNGNVPTARQLDTPSARERALVQNRVNGYATVMADGKVLLSGGAQYAVDADHLTVPSLGGISRHVAIWNPATKAWTQGAEHQQIRVYHSVAMLLQDATVLTGGGGAPGPQTNLNVEIYYPPYLFTSKGTAAPRPAITSAPDFITWGKTFSVSSDAAISRVTLVRAGSASHSVNFDQRFLDLTAVGLLPAQRTVWAPANRNVAPPGWYMLFVFNLAGTPSVAKMVKLG